jgi:predicted lipoprotein
MDIRMVLTARRLGAVAGLVLVAMLAACARVPGVYVYESDRSRGTAASGTRTTDAKTYVAGAWSSKIVPTVHDKAVEVTTVAAAIAKDPEAAGRQYGHQAGNGSPYAFMVKGSGTVTKVDTSAPTGPLTVEVPQAGGKPLTVTIATGPVIAGTAVRDAVGFISFGDFTNQIEYANVANQINNRVKTEVVAKIDRAAVTGKKITFYGAFSALTPGNIFLVPTELQVAS